MVVVIDHIWEVHICFGSVVIVTMQDNMTQFFFTFLFGFSCSSQQQTKLETFVLTNLSLPHFFFLFTSERIFQDSSNSKNTVRRCLGTCGNALELKTKITRYNYKNLWQKSPKTFDVCMKRKTTQQQNQLIECYSVREIQGKNQVEETLVTHCPVFSCLTIRTRVCWI